MCKGPEARTHWVYLRNIKRAGVKSGRIVARDESRDVTGAYWSWGGAHNFSKSDEKPMEGFVQKNDQVQFRV